MSHRRIKKDTLPPTLKNHIPTITTLLDKMVDGREFESLVRYKGISIDPASEIRKSLQEIQTIRNRPAICYLANVVNPQTKVSISIDDKDDLPFSEMILAIPANIHSVDIVLVTPGGSAEQVAKFVDKLRPRFENVTFILPYMAMSAGTIFSMSGNEIIMGKNSYIGPTDPQTPNKDGVYMPAQAILTLIAKIQEDGEKKLAQGKSPDWSHLQILKQLDGKEIGNALNASSYSMELVQRYLYNYKFKDWNKHSDGKLVTDAEKEQRATEIAEMLCRHAQWKTHSRGITRDVAWDECKIKITHTETIEGLDKAIRRFWALVYWIFENSPIYKVFISEMYCIFRTLKTQ